MRPGSAAGLFGSRGFFSTVFTGSGLLVTSFASGFIWDSPVQIYWMPNPKSRSELGHRIEITGPSVNQKKQEESLKEAKHPDEPMWLQKRKARIEIIADVESIKELSSSS